MDSPNTSIVRINREQEQSRGITFNDIQAMGRAIADSRLFGVKNENEAVALLLLAQAEGLHPMTAICDYHIVDGRPSKKAEAMLRDFIAAGGKVTWNEMSDERCEATFTHPQADEVTISWDMERAKRAELLISDRGKPKANWKRYPRQMLRARVISEAVRAIFPAATSGQYAPEDVIDFDRKTNEKPTPPPPADVPQAEHDDDTHF